MYDLLPDAIKNTPWGAFAYFELILILLGIAWSLITVFLSETISIVFENVIILLCKTVIAIFEIPSNLIVNLINSVFSTYNRIVSFIIPHPDKSELNKRISLIRYIAEKNKFDQILEMLSNRDKSTYRVIDKIEYELMKKIKSNSDKKELIHLENWPKIVTNSEYPQHWPITD